MMTDDTDDRNEDLEDAPDDGSESVERRRQDYLGVSRSDRRTAGHIWLISYSDFMTIMMIFFLAMFGYSFLARQSIEKENQPMALEEFAGVVSDMKEKMGDQIRLVQDVDKVTVELGEGVLFRSGSADLSPAAARTLAELGDSIRRVEGEVIVEGHTDNVRIVNGPFKSNWELSAARAFSVIQTLTSAGVPADRLAAWGFGENRPKSGNETLEGRAKNRRIDIVIFKKQEKKA